MVDKSAYARTLRWLQVVTLNTKNVDAPEAKHCDLSANAYVDNPTCPEGYPWSNYTYKCEPVVIEVASIAGCDWFDNYGKRNC